MSMLMVAAAGAALGSFLLQRSQQAQSQVQAQRDALALAHQALQGFVLAHGRLPCPATARGGHENCGSGAGKGWLPAASLLAPADAPDAPVPVSLAMRYLVDHSEQAGLAPLDETSSTDGMGFCQRLGPIQAASGLAYGIAVAAQGASDAASGVNADFSQPLLESPRRPVDPVYRDKVSVRTRGELSAEARCGDVGASLDALAVASTWVTATTDIQRANVERADINAEINTLGVMSDGFYVVDALADLANGLYNATDNTIKLGLASLNPALVAYAPVHAVGVSKAWTGVALSAVDSARNVGTLVIRAHQVDAFKTMSHNAIEQPVWQGAQDMLVAARSVGLSFDQAPP